MHWAHAIRRCVTLIIVGLSTLLTSWVSLAISADELAIIINDRDPLSVQIGEYYRLARHIPATNVLHVDLPTDRSVITVAEFRLAYAATRRNAPTNIQAFALTWAQPYAVDCMSITAAFTFGFAPRYCAKGCRATEPNPYFDAPSRRPHNDFAMRPTIAIAALTFTQAKQLIDRGVAADFTNPQAHAYLVVTADKARSTRTTRYVQARRRFGSRLPISIVRLAGIARKSDVMFYFTGAKSVPYLDTLEFLPGAIADHLTSAGGKLTDSKQMSSLRWLEAGATGSYGTVTEPCNFPQKFPDPAVLMSHYLDGDALIEAYWKSVLWPGQGIIIGEPLAKPFAVADAATGPHE